MKCMYTKLLTTHCCLWQQVMIIIFIFKIVLGRYYEIKVPIQMMSYMTNNLESKLHAFAYSLAFRKLQLFKILLDINSFHITYWYIVHGYNSNPKINIT